MRQIDCAERLIMITVLHIITTVNLGGAEKQLLTLSKTMSLNSLNVSVLYLKGRGDLKNEFKRNGIDCTKLTDLRNSLPAIYYFYRQKNSIIHAHLPRAELLGAALSLMLRIPLVTSKHNTEKFYPKSNYLVSRWLSKFVNRVSVKIICISGEVQNFLNNSNEFEKSQSHKLQVVHYGISKTRSLDSRPIKRRVSRFKIMTACRLTEQKKVEMLIKSVAILQRNGCDVSLDIFGEGDQQADLQRLVAELEVDSDSVHFKGAVSNIDEHFHLYDLFILSTNYEGFGLVLLEAASCGLPILASRIPVLKEIWIDDVFLFDNKSENELVSRIYQLWSSESLLRKNAVLALERAKYFTIEKSEAKITSIYTKILSI
jgi:glycosyltransferase involved in cell wall biosynthesis